ncbi:hypothetical protein T484DRAFT_1883658 [Baffinella frigidus]|nr:hypothetical protein T484DRAFT_1883658 [Cryptophyta sp. CCMP2293]
MHSRAARVMGDQGELRQKELARAAALRDLKVQVDRQDVQLAVDGRVREIVSAQRQMKLVGGEGEELDEERKRDIEEMNPSQLRRFEADQYLAMQRLEGEMAKVAEMQRDAELQEKLETSERGAAILGVAKQGEKPGPPKSADELRDYRLNRMRDIAANRAAKTEVLQRQRQHLQIEKQQIMKELETVKNAVPTSATHQSIETLLHYHSTRFGEEPAASEEKPIHERKRGPGFKAPTIAEKTINEMVNKYHEDRRDLERLKREREGVVREIAAAQNKSWKPIEVPKDDDPDQKLGALSPLGSPDGKASMSALQAERAAFKKDVCPATSLMFV